MPKMQLPNPTIIRHDKPALPRDWSTLPGADGLVFQSDVAVSKRSTLRAKVLLFRDGASMRRFWSKALGRPALSHNTLAVSNVLTVKVHFCKVKGKPQRPPELRVDPRYFCALGFSLEVLSPETIVHESVHAGFAYSRRVGGKHDWLDDCEEERVCYPAGRIADRIIRVFHKEGFFRES